MQRIYGATVIKYITPLGQIFPRGVFLCLNKYLLCIMRIMCTLMCINVYAETIAITTLQLLYTLYTLNLGKLEKNNKEQTIQNICINLWRIYKILELLRKLLCIVCMVPQSVGITGIEAYTAGVYRYTKYTFQSVYPMV